MQALAKFIYFKVMGWKMVGEFPGHLDKFVIIVVPRTSNLDFFLGLIVRKIWNQQINWIGKKSLFKFPYGWYFRRVGGAPVDRNKNNDMVNATAALFKGREKFRLTLAPEGTRKKVTTWKTGFYYISKTANVPIVMVAFDYGHKQVKIGIPYFPTADQTADFEVFHAFFKGVVGKNPDNSF